MLRPSVHLNPLRPLQLCDSLSGHQLPLTALFFPLANYLQITSNTKSKVTKTHDKKAQGNNEKDTVKADEVSQSI